MSQRESTYTTAKTAEVPYTQRLHITREDIHASGLILPVSIASVEYHLDLKKLTIPEGIYLPNESETTSVLKSRQDITTDYDTERFTSLRQLRDPLVRFVATAMTVGTEFTFNWTDEATDSEERMFREVAQPNSNESFHGGMYL